jgi:TonB-dependent receptor
LLPYVLFTDGDFRHGNVLAGEYTMGPGGDVRLLHEVLNVIKGVENPSLETYTRDDYKSNRSDYEGSELLTAAYVMTEISLGPTIKLIPGVRYERDVTEYAAAQGDASLPFPNLFYVHKDTTTSRVNEHVLPMIHLRYSPVEWFSARIAYTHTLSRPSYDVIVPRVDILRDMVVWNNYALEPEFAENLDVYLSFRQNTIGLFTVGGFTKRIENMIFGLDRRVILNPDDYHLSPKEANKDIYTQANSSHPARVWGIEMDWQTIFWYLPVPFNGLVLNVNYTRAFSGADYPRTVVNRELDLTTFTYTYSNVDTFYTERLQFQPDHILNASLGFDYEGFSGRVSLVYQSGIFQKADFWKELSSSSDEYMRFDLSVKQALPWYGLQIFLNVSNATGAMERTLNARSRFPATIQHYGSTAEIGLRVRF